MKHFFTILLFSLIFGTANSQTYPVQVNTQLLPPFTPYLADYTAPGVQKLMVQIRLNDPTLPDYTCKFRITIEGVNITIRTKPSFAAQPITIQGGGIPEIFYGEDLAEYFKPNALDFSGITRSQYEKGAQLPEGVYRFTIEVLDYHRGTLVSSPGNAMAWIILNDPPMLNLPMKNSKVQIVDPNNIPFTWTPRHTGSPNAAFTTEYIFRLVEIWPLNRNPYDAFLTQPVLYETTTNLTQIAYGPAEPALLPGRKYGWQVQAVDTDGRDLFKNQGKSEVFVFQYGDALSSPDGLYLQNAGPSSLNIRWEAPSSGLDPSGYRVQYREHNNRKSDAWYEITTQDLWKTIDKLQPETEYEVQLRSELNSQFSNYSAAQVFKTLPASTGDFSCSTDVHLPPIPASNTPAPKLNINDVIHAGGYEVEVRKVTANAGGTYTGEGVAVVPYFMGAKVHVTFKDINVNEQFWLTAGEIKTVWNVNSPFLVTVEKPVDASNAPTVGAGVAVTIAGAEELVLIKGTIIATVTKDSDGNIVVYTTNGETKILPKGKSYGIVDEAGNGYVVDKQGNIAKTTATEAQEAIDRGNRDYNIALRFEKGNGKFGFDEKKYDALTQYYQKLEDGQPIAWKAITQDTSDPVSATLEGKSYDPKKIHFDVNGAPLTSTSSESGKFNLSVTGKAGGTQEELLAVYAPTDTSKNEVLGKLNLVSYDKVSRNVVIVPVNMEQVPSTISVGAVTDKLNKIYLQAIADWRVSMTDNIKVDFDDKFDDGESGLLTNYTDDMKKVINAYGVLQDNTYYLFLINDPKSGPDALGYMPRSKQAGFIFVDNHTKNGKTIDPLNTIAHELGHGAFNLQHTFKEFTALTEGSTDNIMDYTNGVGDKLYKYQWDHIHDPQRVIGLFEDDEDSEYGVRGKSMLPDDFLNNDKATFTFLTPIGTYITLPKRIKFVGFLHGFSSIEEALNSKTIVGSLTQFRLDDVDYTIFGSSGNIYTGQKPDGTSGIFEDNASSKSKPDYVILAINQGDGLFVKKFKYSANIKAYDPSDDLKTIDQDFDASFLYSANEAYGKMSLGSSVDQGQYEVTDKENDLVSDHEDKPTLLLANKIAQIQNMYPVYFKEFIVDWEDWKEIPQVSDNKSYDPYNNTNVSITNHGVWDIKVGSTKELLDLWKNPKSAEDKLKYYRLLITDLCAYISNQINESQNFWASLTTKTDRYKLISELSKLSEEDYGKLTVNQRVITLQILAYTSYPVYTIEGETEKYILRLFTSVDEQQDKYVLLDALVGKRDVKDEKFLLPALSKDVTGLDNPEFSELMVLLVSWIQQRPPNVPIEELIKQILNPQPVARRQIPFSGSFFAGNSEYFDKSGNMTLSSTVAIEGCTPHANEVTGQSYNSCENTYTLKDVPPYEIISIKFMDDYSIGDQYFKKNSTVEVPAIFAYMLFNNENGKRIAKTVKIGVNVVLIAASAGSYSAAIVAIEGGAELTGAWLFTKATVDAGVALTDITLTFKESELNSSPEGKRILDDWNQFTHLYWNIRLTGDFAELAVYKLNDLYVLIETAIKNRKLGTVVVDDAMASKLRSVYNSLEQRSGLVINRELLSGASGGSAFKGTYKDFQKSFGEVWPSQPEGDLLNYTLPQGPGNFPPSGFRFTETPVITNSPNPTAYVITNPVLSTSWVNKNGQLISNELKALGFKEQESISEIGLLEIEQLTPEIKTALSNGTKAADKKGVLTILEVDGAAADRVLIMQTAEKTLVIRATGKAVQIIADIEAKEKDKETCDFCNQPTTCDCYKELAKSFTVDVKAVETIREICSSNPVDGLSICTKLRSASFPTTSFLQDAGIVLADANHLSNKKSSYTSAILDAYNYLYTNHTSNDPKAPYARVDWNSLASFNKLTDKVKAEVIKFSDNKDSKTLIDFCADLTSVPDFLKFVNDQQYFDFVDGFLIYRAEKNKTAEQQVAILDNLAERLGEMKVSNIISNSVATKIEFWLDKAADVVARNGKFKDGKKFESYIAGQLTSKGQVYEDLRNRFVDTNGVSDIDERTIYQQVQFCLGGDCASEGNYFIADFVFLKVMTDPVTLSKILDVVIIDTKLSLNTNFTINQRATVGKSSFIVKAVTNTSLTKNPIKGSAIEGFVPGAEVIRSNFTFYKVYSNGAGTYNAGNINP